MELDRPTVESTDRINSSNQQAIIDNRHEPGDRPEDKVERPRCGASIGQRSDMEVCGVAEEHAGHGILDIGGSVEEEVRRALGGGIRGLAAAGAVHTDITKEGSEILPLSDPRNRLRVWGRAISSAR